MNGFIHPFGIFDKIADVGAATLDPATWAMRAQFVPNSNAGPGDNLHPNRAGYQAMADTIDATVLAPDQRR